MNSFEAYIDYLSSGIEDPAKFAQRVLITILVIVIAYLIMKLVGKLIEHFVTSTKVSFAVRSTAQIIVSILAIFLISSLWFTFETSMSIIIVLIVGFVFLAVKDIILDLVAYFYIRIVQPYNIGHRIKIDDSIGEIVNFNFVQITLAEVGDILDSESPTGRYVYIPNRFIFQKKVIDYTHNNPFIMQDIYILIGFEEDRDLAIRLAGKIAFKRYEEILEKYEKEVKSKEIEDDDLEEFDKDLESMRTNKKPHVRAELDDNGFRIYIRYFTKYQDKTMNNAIMKNELYDAFVAHDIKMPAPKLVRIQELDGLV